MKQLAILDYGIGGLDLYCRIKALHPAMSLQYFSDAGVLPYGKMKQEELLARLTQVASFLKAQGVEHLIIACHSASTVAKQVELLPITDMIEATKACIRSASQVKKLGIIGGGRTIEEASYQQFAVSLELTVTVNNAQPFSIAIENELTEEVSFQEEMARILQPLGDINALLLACTHYPLIKKRISIYYQNRVAILDPMEHLMRAIQEQLLPAAPTAQGEYTTDVLYTTGNVDLMQELALKLYGLADLPVQQAKV